MPIHPSVIVHPTARLGNNVSIGPYVVIGPDTVIGDNCQIHSNVTIEYTEMGEGCIVYPHASLGFAPQSLSYKNEKTKLVIGSHSTFREGFTAHRGTIQDKGVTRIGSNCFLMAGSHVAHDCVLGDNVIFANNVLLAGHVEIGDGVFISGLAAIHQRVRVGRLALLSGGSMTVQDVAPFAIIQGDRSVLRGMNKIGMKRAGIDRESMKLIKDAYKIIFYSGLTLSEALKDPLFLENNPHLNELKRFLANSTRGLTRPASSVESSEEVTV